jgi:hypothetical protein
MVVRASSCASRAGLRATCSTPSSSTTSQVWTAQVRKLLYYCIRPL